MIIIKKKYSKYRNVKVRDEKGKKIVDSCKEFKRWKVLELLEKAGEIKNLQRQVRFELLESFKDNDGRTERGITYVADFTYFCVRTNRNVVEDIKSEMTKKLPDYVMKRKLFKTKYPQYYFLEKI